MREIVLSIVVYTAEQNKSTRQNHVQWSVVGLFYLNWQIDVTPLCQCIQPGVKSIWTNAWLTSTPIYCYTIPLPKTTLSYTLFASSTLVWYFVHQSYKQDLVKLYLNGVPYRLTCFNILIVKVSCISYIFLTNDLVKQEDLM